MRLIEGIENLTEKLPYPVLTIGNFDGVHLGHQAILQMVKKRAKKENGTSIVLTFEPHPMKIIAIEKAPRLITPFKEKVRLIEGFGIEVFICIKFTKEFSKMEASDFVKNILVDVISVKEVFVGSNYFFGRNRKGSPELLKGMGEKYGFKVWVVHEIKLNDIAVSSSEIRCLIDKGKVEEASRLLGRDYSIEGVVVEGSKRGKKLFNTPTANIATSSELLPKDGVYAVTVQLQNESPIEGKTYQGAANIGYNPTFGGERLGCEVHIFEFDKNILGRTLRINFAKRIRDEIKFHKTQDLALQIKKDIEVIKKILNSDT